MSEINMTPFVDVILVLLIIFLVTLPLVQHNIGIELPTIKSQKLTDHTDPIRISLNANGHYFWEQDIIEPQNLHLKLGLEARRDPKPVVLIFADKNSRYEDLAKLLAGIHQSGLGKIGFITHEGPYDRK